MLMRLILIIYDNDHEPDDDCMYKDDSNNLYLSL